MNRADIPIESLLKRLHLANTRRVWSDMVARAEKEQWSFRDFLAVLISEEVAHRQQTRMQRLTRRAGFPFLKTIDDFDFTYQSTVRLQLLGSALSPDFVTEGRSLILSGKPGRGKTHLAIAIAYRAIQNDFDAFFVTAAELIDDLSRAARQGYLVNALTRYTRPDVTVIDEVGYLSYGPDAANVLFHVVNQRNLQRRSMIFTTNKSLSVWGNVLHDDDLAAAIIDRVLERGRLLQLDGPSLRTKHLGLDDPTLAEASNEPARISGTHICRATLGGTKFASSVSSPLSVKNQRGRSSHTEDRWHHELEFHAHHRVSRSKSPRPRNARRVDLHPRSGARSWHADLVLRRRRRSQNGKRR
jgi:DNA replication protein DnaC